MSDVRRFPDAEAVSLAAAGKFVELTCEATARDGRACVALSRFLRPECGRLVWLVDAVASAGLGVSP